MDKNNINFWQKDFENSSFYKKYSKTIFTERHEFDPNDNSADDYYDFFIDTFFPCIWFSHNPTYGSEKIIVRDGFNEKQNINNFPLTTEGINDAVNCLFEIVNKKPETDRNNINYWKEKFISTPLFQQNLRNNCGFVCDEDSIKVFSYGQSSFRIFVSKRFGNNIWVWKTERDENRIMTKLEEQYFPLTDEGFDEALAYMIKLNQEE